MISQAKGQLVAAALAGSWRTTPPALNFSPAQLAECAPLLYGSGAGALGWWRARNSDLKSTPSAQVLLQAFRLQALQAAIHEEKLERVFRSLGQKGIEPILAKGWAAALLYPERALRPYGDLDILVRPEQFKDAENVLRQPELSDCWVDLHEQFSELTGRELNELFARSQTFLLNSQPITVLSPEDHLALLSVHLLKHGAWRPLWLCDLGAAIES